MKMMIAIGIDPKIVRIIESLYNETECTVVIDRQLTEWFAVKIGLRQGFPLSPTLFNIFLEFVMQELKKPGYYAQTQIHRRHHHPISYFRETTSVNLTARKCMPKIGYENKRRQM